MTDFVFWDPKIVWETFLNGLFTMRYAFIFLGLLLLLVLMLHKYKKTVEFSQIGYSLALLAVSCIVKIANFLEECKEKLKEYKNKK